jgi:hypothetical protein
MADQHNTEDIRPAVRGSVEIDDGLQVVPDGPAQKDREQDDAAIEAARGQTVRANRRMRRTKTTLAMAMSIHSIGWTTNPTRSSPTTKRRS